MARITLNNNRGPGRTATTDTRARAKHRKSNSRGARGKTNVERKREGERIGTKCREEPIEEEGRQMEARNVAGRRDFGNANQIVRRRRRRISVRESARHEFRSLDRSCGSW